MGIRGAFIISASNSFLPGVIGILEALERYGHREDVHVLFYHDMMLDILERAYDKKYKFKLTLTALSELRKQWPVDVPKRAQRGWDCRFYNYFYAVDKIDRWDYDSVAIWNADALLLNNISKYFDVATRFIVLSNNYHRLKVMTDKPIVSPMRNPICDVPFITSDRDLLWRVWVRAQEEPFLTQGRNDMLLIFNSIIELEKWDKVFLVPYDHWVYPVRVEPRRVFSDGNGSYYFCDNSRINCVHGPHWKWGFVNRDRHNEIEKKVYRMIFEIYERACAEYGLELQR